jgi:hypothetical protein
MTQTSPISPVSNTPTMTPCVMAASPFIDALVLANRLFSKLRA